MEVLKVNPIENEYGKLFKLPYTIENIKKELNDFLLRHPDHFENKLENDDYQVFSVLNENAYNFETEKARLFKIIDFVNKSNEDLGVKYGLILGILKITLYNKKILELSIKDILSISDAFIEVSLTDLGLYDELLGNIDKLCSKLKKGKTLSEKYFIMLDAKDEIDYVFDNDKPENKNMIS